MSDTSKVWFLTGATSNFGVALTRTLLKAGHCVVATARSPSKLPFTEEESDALMILPLDVSDPSSISVAFDAAKKRFGRIDVVVNKAGSNAVGELEALSDERARGIFTTQFWGPARVQEEAAKIFTAQGDQGLIFNITSPAAVFPGPLGTIMCASKAASEVWTLARARGLPSVVAVNVRPGGFEEHPQADLKEQPPAYGAKDLGRTVSATLRSAMGNQPPGIGDVHKMVAQLVAIADQPRNQLQSAILLGSESYGVSRAMALKQIAHISHSQNILRSVKTASTRSSIARVWFVSNANTTLGQTLVRVLLAAGSRVAAVTPANETQSLAIAHDHLLLVRLQDLSVASITSAMDEAVERFGRLDLVVNAPSRGPGSQGDSWDLLHGAVDRIFWSSMNTSSAGVKTLRERNPTGAGGRIFNILATESGVGPIVSTMNKALEVGTIALSRELPRKWNIGVSAITIDGDLHADDETARTLVAMAELSYSILPSQLSIGSQSLALAQYAAQIELDETCSEQVMARAMAMDRDYIDGRARVGLYLSIFTLIISPSPSHFTMFILVLSTVGWGLRLVAVETFKRLFTRK
ncbi:unnamed protein product [Peniophora sp. CBMAI 1063]|nr:unnamed protein product [Peniophora sp. CBMAI 1063]